MARKLKKRSASDRFKEVSWGSPKVILILITVGMGIYAGGHFMKIGIFLGAAMALAIVILLAKSPGWIQARAFAHPFTADIVLSSLATMFVSGFFGTGLALGIAAVTCGLFLSWAIPPTTRRFATAI